MDSDGPSEPCVRLWSRSPNGRGNLGGRVPPHCKVEAVNTVSCRETADAIKMRFGLWTRVGTANHVLRGGSDPREKGAFFLGGGCFVPLKMLCNRPRMDVNVSRPPFDLSLMGCGLEVSYRRGRLISK